MDQIAVVLISKTFMCWHYHYVFCNFTQRMPETVIWLNGIQQHALAVFVFLHLDCICLFWI